MTDNNPRQPVLPADRCGDVAREGSFEWICDRPKGHAGDHRSFFAGKLQRAWTEEAKK